MKEHTKGTLDRGIVKTVTLLAVDSGEQWQWEVSLFLWELMTPRCKIKLSGVDKDGTYEEKW